MKLIVPNNVYVTGTRSFCDRAYWFIDYLYRLQFYQEQPSYFINVRRSQLNARLGRAYSNIIKGLAAKGVVDINPRYVSGRFSKSYRLAKPYREAPYRLVDVNTPLIARKIATHQRAQRNNSDWHPGGRINWANIGKLKLDLVAAKSGANVAEERHFLAQYELNRHQFYSIDEQGRHYHYVAAMPRGLRRFLSFPEDDLVILDFRHCQPSLHTTLYREDCPERQRFVTLCQEGKLWGFLNQLLKRPFDLTCPKQKKVFKETCFRQLFYGPVRENLGYLQSAFAREFPILWERIREEKTPDHAALPRKMQALEASIVIDGTLSSNFFCISIHDAVLTTESDAAKVREVMENVFIKKIGFRPAIEATSLTTTRQGAMA